MRPNRFLEETDPEVFIKFGKYRGQELAIVAEEDPEYLKWVLANVEDLPKEVARMIEDALS